MLAVQLSTSAFTAVLTLFLVRALGPEGYGVFALALAVGSLAALPSDLGISSSASRFIAEHRDDRGAIAGVVIDAFRLKVVAAGAASILLFAASEIIASAYNEPALVWPLRGVAVSLFGESLLLLVGGSFVAQGKVSWNLVVTVVESTLELTASIVLVVLGAGAAGAAFGRAIAYLVGAALGVALVVRLVGLPITQSLRTRGGRTRSILRYAAPLAIVDATWTLFTKIDILLIGALIGTTSVAIFQAPMRFITFLYYPGYSIAGGVAPTLAHRDAAPRDAMRRTERFTGALRYIVIFQAALVAPLLVWAGPITDLLLGSGYEESAIVMRALTPYVFLLGIAPLVSIGATYLGEARARIPITILTVIVNTVLDLILLPWIGVVGAAIGTDVAFALYVPAQLLICQRRLEFALRPIVVTALRGAVAAAAMAAVLLMIGTTDLSFLDWLVGALAGTLAFAAVLILTREVSSTEIRVAVGSLRRSAKDSGRA